MIQSNHESLIIRSKDLSKHTTDNDQTFRSTNILLLSTFPHFSMRSFFLIQSILLWNALSKKIRTPPSRNSFKIKVWALLIQNQNLHKFYTILYVQHTYVICVYLYACIIYMYVCILSKIYRVTKFFFAFFIKLLIKV